MAERCGVHLTTITSMLSGRTKVTLKVASLLTKELGIGIDDLIKDHTDAREQHKAEKKRVATSRAKNEHSSQGKEDAPGTT